MTHEQEQQRAELQKKLRCRIDRIREVIDVYDVGGLSEGKALSEIEEIASGEADRIVRVGHKHTPEVQS